MIYDDVEYDDVAAGVYTIYPIDAGAAFVTPCNPYQCFLSKTILLIHLTTSLFRRPALDLHITVCNFCNYGKMVLFLVKNFQLKIT